jgi:glyoxylase-like metal-dependent hydrolase (beta-lactamase superfamily II)
MTIDVLSELLRFAPDVYGLRWDNHVAMFTVTPEGVLVVDPCGEGNPNTPSLLKATIRSVTDQPVRYVVYSHSAWDHSMGGIVFADTAQFVSQARAQERIAAAGKPSTPIPDITFQDTLTLELGGRRWDLYASKLTPVDDYLILHDPTARLLMYVDCFQPGSIPLPLHGQPADLQKRIDWLRSFDFDLLLTGHATPRTFLTKDELQAQSDYLTDLVAAIEGAERAGHAQKSPEMTAYVLAALDARWTGWRRYPDRVGPHIANCFDYAEGVYPAPRMPRQ